MIITSREGSLFIHTGPDPDFKAVWCFSKQSYTIFYKGKYFMTKYNFDAVKPYLM